MHAEHRPRCRLPAAADPPAPQKDRRRSSVPALRAQPCTSRPRPSRRRHAAHPPIPKSPPPRARACFSSLVTTMTHRLTHLPRPSWRERHPGASTHTLSHRCPQANAIASTHHTHIQTLVLGLSLPESQKRPEPRLDRSRHGSQSPLSPALLPYCSPRPRRAGSAPRCAQVAFLKGKLHQPPEALCSRQSSRPAALLAAPPELVVFWFRGGGG